MDTENDPVADSDQRERTPHIHPISGDVFLPMRRAHVHIKRELTEDVHAATV